ncbi:ABC transporter ATP-binding protein [uncultured Granulicatella sp.]|uniref:ABC transporter ATP-binding protein n=1 Tax=uncultured Granulicatella sp. TaxID=316089 RepID=UPI0026040C42|nr:ABC transporter ATP-binding protein [uncultured Granulicatella sp.]
MIEIKDVTKSYGRHKVLQNVSFEIMEGELFGLLGPNGAGKSTLIDILTGIQSMDSGEIFINGKSIKTDKVEIRKQLGLVPQDIALLEELNAFDNLEYFGGLYGLAGQELKSQIEKLLEVAGLTDKKKEKVKNYSGGMKRRLNIAVAMLHNPSILILDEPTVGVDAQSRQHIFDYIQSLAEQGTTILYTSHYMEEIETLCKRVFILDLGEEVAYGTKEEVKKLVGHTQTVSLTLDRVPAGFDEVLKNSENGIQFVTVNGQDIALTIDQTIFSMMKLIEQVEQAQLVIKSVNVKETTLEEAFLQLTGKTLRD